MYLFWRGLLRSGNSEEWLAVFFKVNIDDKWTLHNTLMESHTFNWKEVRLTHGLM